MIPMIGWTWDECVDAIGELGALAGCEQQPDFHGEGDVATHTRMVLAALESDPAFAALEDQLRTECFLAALLHDVAKPACTRVEDGRITARGHARVGAIEARRILWQLGVEPVARERVCTLIHYHLHPFWALERTDADRHARAVSLPNGNAPSAMPSSPHHWPYMPTASTRSPEVAAIRPHPSARASTSSCRHDARTDTARACRSASVRSSAQNGCRW